MADLQNFADFEKSLNLRSQTLVPSELLEIFNLLSERFGLTKQPDCRDGFIYKECYFGVPEVPITFSYRIEYVSNEQIRYRIHSNLLEFISRHTDEEDILELIDSIQNLLFDFLGFERSYKYETGRLIKAITPEIKTALGIETDYEFNDVIGSKLVKLNQSIIEL
jgi:hypothetical protein